MHIYDIYFSAEAPGCMYADDATLVLTIYVCSLIISSVDCKTFPLCCFYSLLLHCIRPLVYREHCVFFLRYGWRWENIYVVWDNWRFESNIQTWWGSFIPLVVLIAIWWVRVTYIFTYFKEPSSFISFFIAYVNFDIFWGICNFQFIATCYSSCLVYGSFFYYTYNTSALYVAWIYIYITNCHRLLRTKSNIKKQLVGPSG